MAERAGEAQKTGEGKEGTSRRRRRREETREGKGMNGLRGDFHRLRNAFRLRTPSTAELFPGPSAAIETPTGREAQTGQKRKQERPFGYPFLSDFHVEIPSV